MAGDVVGSNGRTSQDAELETAAMDALMHYAGVRVWTDALQITAHNGIVNLAGHVRTRSERQVSEKTVRGVAGVQDVVNQVYVDNDLEIAVAQALGNDARSRTSFPGILVGSAFGEVFLKGSVASQEIKKAAGEIAAKVEGVRDVHNELVAPEPPKPAAAPAAAAKPAAAARPAAAAKPAPNPQPKAEEGAEEASGTE